MVFFLIALTLLYMNVNFQCVPLLGFARYLSTALFMTQDGWTLLVVTTGGYFVAVITATSISMSVEALLFVRVKHGSIESDLM